MAEVCVDSYACCTLISFCLRSKAQVRVDRSISQSKTRLTVLWLTNPTLTVAGCTDCGVAACGLRPGAQSLDLHHVMSPHYLMTELRRFFSRTHSIILSQQSSPTASFQALSASASIPCEKDISQSCRDTSEKCSRAGSETEVTYLLLSRCLLSNATFRPFKLYLSSN